jgi:uncharacterized protein (DUF2141 family)
MKRYDSLFLKGKQKYLVLITGLLMFSGFAMSQNRLDVEITGFRSNKGVLMLQLFDENQKVVAREKGIIQDKKCTVSLNGINSGKFGIRYFHDENLSGQMETNLFGKPVEGYGFSNNVKGKFGPPSFEKWLFDITADKKITLKIVY